MRIQVTGAYTVQEDQTVQSQDEPAFNLVAGSGKRGGALQIDGRVEVTGGADSLVGITGEDGTGDTHVDIGSTGVLTVSGDGDVTGLQAHGPMYVDNQGDISVTSSGGVAVGFDWDHSPFSLQHSFQSSGQFTVSGATEAYGAIYATHSTFGVDSLDVTSGGKAVGVEFMSSGEFICENATVSGVGEAVGCSFGASGLKSGPAAYISGDLSVHATGHGSTAVGIEFTSAASVGGVFNSGIIQAETAILDLATEGGAGVKVVNGGKIYGDVTLGAGDDGVFNPGLVRGEVHLGAGADTYLSGIERDGVLHGSGSVNGAVYGDDGADTLVGGKRGDVLYGDGADVSTTGGADSLSGGGGDDSLYGGAKADSLEGGRGGDLLSGGGGADHFVFKSVADSAPGAEDHILDLSNADVIDLSAIDANTTADGDQAFTLVQTLDGHAGEAALVWDKADHQTVLQLDVDGDGTADATVLIAGKHTDFSNFAL